jgi:cytochrome P450
METQTRGQPANINSNNAFGEHGGYITMRPEDVAAQVLTDPTTFADEPRLHSALARLRANAPVSWVDVPRYRPFWAITKHADIMEIERNNTLWINAPRAELLTEDVDEQNRVRRETGADPRLLVHMDGDYHRRMRAVGAEWFRPNAMRALKNTIDERAKRYVDKMSEKSGCDFVTEVAQDFPLYTILSLLGLPEDDFSYVLKLTKELFGRYDKEFQRSDSNEGSPAVADSLVDYFAPLTSSRRANPTDDLASAIANARIDGEYLSDSQTLAYYLIIATAGHDTTSAAIAGGLRALIEHPSELERLQKHPDLMPTAVEEALRWSTPAKNFMRTATKDTQVRGVTIAAGESTYLSYVSGNRDEEVFDQPFRFDIARDPNKHLSFGFGVHFCLGAALARLEINSLLSELVPRLDAIELDGEPILSDTLFVGGLKHLPIRYCLK